MLDISGEPFSSGTLLQDNIILDGKYKQYASVKLKLYLESSPQFKNKTSYIRTLWLHPISNGKKIAIRTNNNYAHYEETDRANEKKKRIIFVPDVPYESLNKIGYVYVKFIVPYIKDLKELEYSHQVIYLDDHNRLKISLIPFAKRMNQLAQSKDILFTKQFYTLHDITDKDKEIYPEICEIYNNNK